MPSESVKCRMLGKEVSTCVLGLIMSDLQYIYIYTCCVCVVKIEMDIRAHSCAFGTMLQGFPMRQAMQFRAVRPVVLRSTGPPLREIRIASVPQRV